MRKPAFAYFYGLCILISFSLLTITVQGVSNKHCLLPFFIMPPTLKKWGTYWFRLVRMYVFMFEISS